MNYAQDRLDRKSCFNGGKELLESINEAHGLLEYRGATNEDYFRRAEGHELAGRTLRDMGKCRQSVYHFGMASVSYASIQRRVSSISSCDEEMCEADDLQDKLVKSMGDYAQMTEFAGFPEVGIITLLYFQAGGLPSLDHLQLEDQQLTHKKNNTPKQGCKESYNCGCGAMYCGLVQCFIPYPLNVIDPILQELDNFYIEWKRKHQIRSDSIKESDTFFSNNGFDVGNLCCFWKKGRKKELPFLIQILMLKLLYTSARGGAFLALACEACLHLKSTFQLQPQIARQLQRDYKSHWAYYVFIEYLVVGKRVKPHRRGTIVPYHTPVWDIIRHVDDRTLAGTPHKLDHISTKSQDSSFAQQILTLMSTVTNPSYGSPTNIMHYEPIVMSEINYPPLFVVGDSHVLSIAWQTLMLENNNKCRILVPVPVTGLKAWHCRPNTSFFTHYNMHVVLTQRLPPNVHTIILSAGEIDCREGIGKCSVDLGNDVG